MIEFSGGEWFEITGRGNVYACKMPIFEGDLTTSELVNTYVMIESVQYFVIGVEYWAIANRSLRIGSPVGLFVRGPILEKYQ